MSDSLNTQYDREGNPLNKGQKTNSIYDRFGSIFRKKEKKEQEEYEEKDLSITSFAQVIDSRPEKSIATQHLSEWPRLKLNYYLQNLHNYLGKYCFLYGAFVVEDDEEKTLYNFLLPYNSRRIPTFTHGSFTKDPFMKDMDISLLITCKGCYGPDGKVFVKNCKWYPFSQVIKDKEQKSITKNYVYLKFERASSYTFSHWYAAYERYALKLSKDNRCPPRREDCKKDNDHKCKEEDDRIGRSKCNPEACRINEIHNFTTYSINDVEILNIQENYERKGDEMFIPLGVSKYFLDNISKKINFTHAGDNVDIRVEDTLIETIELITPTQIKDITIEAEATIERKPIEESNPIEESKPIKGGRCITRKRRKRKTNKRKRKSKRKSKRKTNKRKSKSKRKSKRKLFSNIQSRHIVK
jgi:hypothetical protein